MQATKYKYNNREIPKMTAILQMTFSDIFYGMKSIKFVSHISLKFVSKDRNDHKSELMQIVAWCQTDDKRRECIQPLNLF